MADKDKETQTQKKTRGAPFIELEPRLNPLSADGQRVNSPKMRMAEVFQKTDPA